MDLPRMVYSPINKIIGSNRISWDSRVLNQSKSILRIEAEDTTDRAIVSPGGTPKEGVKRDPSPVSLATSSHSATPTSNLEHIWRKGRDTKKKRPRGVSAPGSPVPGP
jgi:hypothetical protein